MIFFVTRQNAARPAFTPFALAAFALAALAFGVFLYLATRSGPIAATSALGLPALPWISLPVPAALPVPASASLPSFLHAFAFTALATLPLRRTRAIIAVTLSWLAIEFAYELGQLTPLVNGTYDPIDLLAATTGCALAGVTARLVR